MGSIKISTAAEFTDFFSDTILNNNTSESEETTVIIANDIDFEGVELQNFGSDSTSNIQSIYNLTIKSGGKSTYKIKNFRKTPVSNKQGSFYILGNFYFCNCTFERLIFENITIETYETSPTAAFNCFYGLANRFVNCTGNNITATGIKTTGSLRSFSYPTSRNTGSSQNNIYNYCAVTATDINVNNSAFVFCPYGSNSNKTSDTLNFCISSVNITGDEGYSDNINIQIFTATNGNEPYFKSCIAKNVYKNIATNADKKPSSQNASTGINEFFIHSGASYTECYSISRYIDCLYANVFNSALSSYTSFGNNGCLYDSERATENGTVINPVVLDNYKKFAEGSAVSTDILKKYQNLGNRGWVTIATYPTQCYVTTKESEETESEETESEENVKEAIISLNGSLGWKIKASCDAVIDDFEIQAESAVINEEEPIAQSVELQINNISVASTKVEKSGTYGFASGTGLNYEIKKDTEYDITLSTPTANSVKFSAIKSADIIYNGKDGIYYRKNTTSGNPDNRFKMRIDFSIDVDYSKVWELDLSGAKWEGYPYVWIPYEGENEGYLCNVYIGERGENGNVLRKCRVYINGKERKVYVRGD